MNWYGEPAPTGEITIKCHKPKWVKTRVEEAFNLP